MFAPALPKDCPLDDDKDMGGGSAETGACWYGVVGVTAGGVLGALTSGVMPPPRARYAAFDIGRAPSMLDAFFDDVAPKRVADDCGDRLDEAVIAGEG